MNYTNLHGSRIADQAFGGIMGYPTTFILDQQRIPVMKFDGLAPTRDIEQEILVLIGRAT